MANHIHLLLQAPTTDSLGRPLRWFMTETTEAFLKARGWRGHFWERRYRACLVEDDLARSRRPLWTPVGAGRGGHFGPRDILRALR